MASFRPILPLFYRFIFIGVFFLVFFPVFILADGLDREIKELETFSKSFSLVKDVFLFEKTDRELILSAIKGMVEGLDAYGGILSRGELEKLENNTLGERKGVGVNLDKENGFFVISRVIKGSPAEKAGLAQGLIVTRINDYEISKLGDEEMLKLIEDSTSDELRLEYHHPLTPRESKKIRLEKSQFKENSVETLNPLPGVLVFRIHQFIKDTPQEIRTQLKLHEHKGVILDLRNNPGGLLISAVELAEMFVPKGVIVMIRDNKDEIVDKYISRRSKEDLIPVVLVLINRETASAAEILAGAIKDLKAGVLIGERSFGKGVVQSIYPVSDDLYIKLTTAKYYTASGISFHQKGIQPDIPVKDSALFTRYKKDDLIYNKALEMIAGLLK
ncbi:MAG: S41 family peptidase [Deltaproteobacteria bacterium]|nr:S41 family peptidase [Deltaproteobacteria bacterium]